MNRILVIIASVLVATFTTTSFAEESAGDHVDDTATTARVKLALLEQSFSIGSSINVETSKGIVQLAGFVDSEKAKAMAARVTAGTEGVESVSNRLNVSTGKRSAGTVLDDTILSAKVKLALVESDATNAGRINVEIRYGVVELSGFAGSYEERDAAVKLVSTMDGVESVLNSIDIMR